MAFANEEHDVLPEEAVAQAEPAVVSAEVLRFGVVSVEQIPAPTGAAGKWCRYIIDVPGGALSGVRQGSQDEVASFAREYAEQLCARTRFKTKVPYMRSQR